MMDEGKHDRQRSISLTKQRASQACDACRQRRIRCLIQVLHDNDTNQICERCQLADLPCTFNMPIKRRGPPAKRRRTSFDSIPKANVEQHAVSGPGLVRIPSSISCDVPRPLTESDNEQHRHAGPSSLIDQFCSEALFDALMQDFMGLVYPTMPVVHLPTFVSDLRDRRHKVDRDFGRFVLALCAVTISISPGKFSSFQQIDPGFLHSTRLQAIDRIHTLLNQTKPPDYYDHSTVEKWAIPLAIGRAYAYLGNRKSIYYHFSEGYALMRDLGCHQTSTYVGLDYIEAQLRRKAFWLIAITYTHVRPGDPQWDSTRDRLLFEEYQASELFPLVLDDEYITKDVLLEQPSDKPSLVVGFIALALINSCLVSIMRDPTVSLFSTTTKYSSDRETLGTCTCGKHIELSPLAGLLRSRLLTLDRVVADLPPELGPQKPIGPSSDVARSLQYETMRLNLHITYRWVQSLLIERLISLSETGSEERADLWDMLQDVCAELLIFVEQMTQEVLVLHGVTLSYKIRQTGASLLDHPFLTGSAAAKRAREQIKAFTDILASLDAIHARS